MNSLALAHRGCSLALGLPPLAVSPSGLIGGSVSSQPLSSLPTHPRASSPWPQPAAQLSCRLMRALPVLGASACMSCRGFRCDVPQMELFPPAPHNLLLPSSRQQFHPSRSSALQPWASPDFSVTLKSSRLHPVRAKLQHSARPTANPRGGPSVARQVSLLGPFPTVHLPDPFLP